VSAALWAAFVSGCGYRAILAPSARQQLSVQAGQALVPEAAAVQAALSGARVELAAAGQLGRDGEFPRLLVDVLRVDETSRGTHVQGSQPVAAGMSIAVVVRARIFPGANAEPALDTGDLRRAVQLSGNADPRADSAAYDDALRAAAERAGRAAARAALGLPEPADELP
jgi:hypothetical protein